MTSPPPDTAFPLGVASFDPLTDRVLIWTYLDGPERCEWEVAADRSFSEAVAGGDATLDGGPGPVTVDVEGLSPGTTYWYRFRAPDGSWSDVGRTRTLPGEGAERLRLAALCCARFGQSEFDAYRAVADVDVDLVVHLGDYVYEDHKFDREDRKPEPDHDCVTLDDYRIRHAQARRDPDARALHAAHPMVVIWDDHDLADNAWRGGAKGHDPEEQGPWEERLHAALQAHQEFLPKRLADPADITSAWRRLDVGDLCHVLCTEGRAHRDEQAGHEGSAPADDPARTLLGAIQADWLEEAVAASSARWVVLLSGTVMSELVMSAPDVLDGVLPEKYAVVDGHAANTDQWDGYLAERRRMAAALARRNGGSLVLSGDIHSSWAIEGPLGPDGVPVAVELVCPPAATTPLGQLFPAGIGGRMAPCFVDQVPGGRWVDVEHRGYLTVDLSPERAEAAWWWVDGQPASEEPADGRPAEQRSGGDGAGTGARRAAVLGRRWIIPRMAPAALVDPEPRVDADGEPRREQGTGAEPRPRGRRTRRIALAAAVTAAVAAGLRRARARSAAG